MAEQIRSAEDALYAAFKALTRPSLGDVYGCEVFGCESWQTCRSQRPSPPYNPQQPEKCRKHKAWMTTLIGCIPLSWV